MKELNDLLCPWGFTVSLSECLWPKYLFWQTFCKANGQFWNDSQIWGEVDWVEGTTPVRVAVRVLWAAHRKIMEPGPSSGEVDWRSTETIPEDFYAA